MLLTIPAHTASRWAQAYWTKQYRRRGAALSASDKRRRTLSRRGEPCDSHGGRSWCSARWYSASASPAAWAERRERPPPGGANNPYALLADLQRDPAATLALPGGDVLASGGSERYQSMLKPHPATVAAIVGTQERLPAIYAFYDRALVARGYTSGRPGGVGSAEFASWEWCGPGTYYRLSIDEEARAFEPAILGGRTYHTVFHATLRGRDTAPCLPDPTPSHVT